MKRNIKNILMISIIILMIIGTVLTIKSVNSNVNKFVNNKPMEMESSNKAKRSKTENKKDESKEKRDKSSKSSKNNANTLNEVDEKEEPPEKPQGEDEMSNEMETPPEMPNMNNNNSIDTIYYVIFGVNSLIISLTIFYLIMSKMNKKSFKETFVGNQKYIYLLLSVLLTSILIYASIYFTNNNISEIKEGNTVEGNNSKSSSKVTYSANKEITTSENIESGSFTSTMEDENTISISGDIDVTLSNIEITKTGDSDGGDNTSFYGTNSAIIAKDGATVNIDSIKVTTDANGANGVFSYGGSATTNNEKSDGTTVNISNSVITTTKNNSGGIMTTGGGTTNAKNLTITTSGQSSAAIRSDRGGGTVNVDGGDYTSNGVGSPAIYSTSDITVKNANLISTLSEGIIIEGKNSVLIDNVNLTDTHTKNVKSKTYKNIFIYQSMSGDASVGQATFTGKDSKIITNNGDSIYVTNTKAEINLENNEFINNDSNGNFLTIQKDSWGKEGSNGGEVTLNMTNQKVDGNIVVDSISTLSIIMKDNSFINGSINSDNTAKEINLTLDTTSSIKLTSDCYVTSLNDTDTTYSNIDFNGYKLYVNGKSIN